MARRKSEAEAERKGTMVDATFIDVPTSSENAGVARDPEMHQTKKGNDRHFGMKAHVGTDVSSGLMKMVGSSAASISAVVSSQTCSDAL